MNEKARLTGTIVHGKGLGHTVGMPTANLRCDEGSALPEDYVCPLCGHGTDDFEPIYEE